MSRWLAGHARRRAWVLATMVIFTVVGMAYSFWWEPVVHHYNSWLTPGDIWSTLAGGPLGRVG